MRNLLLMMLLCASALTAQTLDDPPPSVLFPSYCTTLNVPETTQTVLISPTLNNGGFETAGAGGADVFANWGESGTDVKIVDTIDCHSGVKSCKIAPTIGYANVFINVSNTIGKTNVLKFWAKSTSSPTLVISIGAPYSWRDVLVTNEWREYTVRDITESALINIYNFSNTSALLIDDITLTELTPVTKAQYWGLSSPAAGSLDLNGSEMLTNPTFDANVTGWSSGDGTLTHTTAQKRTGAGAAMWISGSTGMIEVYQSVALANTTTMQQTSEAWVKTNRTQNLFIKIVNQAYGQIYLGSFTSCAAGAWTKLTANYSLPGTQTGVIVRVLEENAALTDTVICDDASLTQSYDCIVVTGVNAGDRTFGAYERILFAGATSFYSILTSYGLKGGLFDVYDNNAEYSSYFPDFADGRSHMLAGSLNRTTGIKSYTDAIPSALIPSASIGKLSNISAINFGGSDGSHFTGTIYPTQIIKYASLPSNIDAMMSYANSYFKRTGNLPPRSYWTSQGTGGQCVLDVDWKNGGKDNSGLGNNLVPFGGAVTRRK